MKSSEVAALEKILFLNEIHFVHLTPNEYSRSKAVMAFGEATMFQSWDGYQALFRVCKVNGAAIKHYPVVIIENPERIDPAALAEAKLIAAPENGQGPLIIEVYR